MAFFYLLTGIVCTAYVLLMLSYWIGWLKTGVPSNLNTDKTEEIFVSIIIPARNEEHNILKCISSICKQTHSSNNFEIIVVDDHSTDRTKELVKLETGVKLVSLLESHAGKKQAITEGIKNAKGSLIITTDADCEMGENWLSTIVAFYQNKKVKMIVGPVLVCVDTLSSNKVSQIMQSQEMTVLSACACGSLYHNMPILCSGANLAYEKQAFLAVNGFEGADKISTGDDMFLMLKIHQKFSKEIAYLKSKDAAVFTRPAAAASQALEQRKRWASKSFSYGFSHVSGIAILIFLTNFLILFCGIMSIINVKFVFVFTVCFCAKILVDFMLQYSASTFFGKKVHPFVFAAASVMYPFYVAGTGLISQLTNYSWKGRIS